MKLPAIFAALFGIGTALAQQSTNFSIKTHVLNFGGRPSAGTILSSMSYRITLDSIGDGLSAGPMSSASFRLQPGFALSFPPPGEVTGLLFLNRERLSWNPEPSVGTYKLYRALVDSLPLLEFGVCEQTGLGAETTFDFDEPMSDDTFFYLVTAENCLAEEGTKGFQSNGTERQGNICP